MAVSNYIPSSRVLQPGVCTSSTRPAAPYNGQVIYETDTGKTLVWNGSAWVMLTNSSAPPGLELIKTQTIGSTVTSVSVTNAFSATYDSYRIVITGSSASGVGANVYYKQSGSTGSTYNSFVTYAGYSAGTITGSNSPNNSVGIHIAITGTTFWSSSFDVHNPYNSGKTTLAGQGVGSDYVIVATGYDSNSASSTDFSINAQSTYTITGGTIRVYGYRNTI